MKSQQLEKLNRRLTIEKQPAYATVAIDKRVDRLKNQVKERRPFDNVELLHFRWDGADSHCCKSPLVALADSKKQDGRRLYRLPSSVANRVGTLPFVS